MQSREVNMLLPVILAGGSGERLWPLSRTSEPKQFLCLNDHKLSLLQETVLRVNKLDNTLAPVIIGNEEHRFLIAEHLRQVNQHTNTKILLEPCSRNTLVAIALAVGFAKQNHPDDIKLLILPADHVIEYADLLQQAVNKALDYADSNNLITFGIKPSYPETGYGYIHADDKNKIIEFIEKPDLTTAELMLSQGNYLWNSGMFLFSLAAMQKEINNFSAEILPKIEQALQKSNQDLDFIRIQNTDYEVLPKISIDYAIMEKSKHGYCIPLDCGWNDIGNWQALYKHLNKIPNNNIEIGNTVTKNCTSSLLYSKDLLLTAIGVDNLVVVATKDAVLVTNQDSSKDLKQLIEELKKAEKPEVAMHARVCRPWGSYENLATGQGFLVKKIIVEPQKTLSLQQHKFRSEHWVVVTGIANVINGDSELVLYPNQSTYIPIGTKHRLSNNSNDILEIIEVQCGSYIDESDIIRFEDQYGRAMATETEYVNV
jgi:mannose-1-phosphate guanylyltransferase/mannose-6-phosphate isomerase